MKKPLKLFAEFGLGRFGGTIVNEFHVIGGKVIAVDKDEAKVNEYMDYTTHAVSANAIVETILNQLGIRNVTFGDDNKDIARFEEKGV